MLTPADLSFADSLRALSGWNQTMADWRRFLAFEPSGCFLALWEGAPAGVITTITYGTTLGWIGMLLVHPNFRRRGIATALLHEAIAYLKRSPARCIKLDATPEGKPAYLKLGFREERVFTRWEGRAVANQSRPLPGWSERFDELDQLAFCAPRARLLSALAAASHAAVALDGKGFGMIRGGSRAYYLGPVVARDPASGVQIVETLLANVRGEHVFWDIFDENREIAHWARERGFVEQRPLTRMLLGEENISGVPAMQIAIAGPELG